MSKELATLQSEYNAYLNRLTKAMTYFDNTPSSTDLSNPYNQKVKRIK